MSENFLDKVYGVRTADETRQIYDDWSKSYESEISENGYATPGRCAKALRSVTVDVELPVLDFGCGTGLSGLALGIEGFATIDGRDLSPGMLALAKDKNVYRDLQVIEPDDPLPKGYAAITAMGVIGSGAAPLSVLDRIVEALDTGGKSVFSFNDHTLQDPRYQGHVDHLIGIGIVRDLFREHGPHLPGRNMSSTVYVLEKL